MDDERLKGYGGGQTDAVDMLFGLPWGVGTANILFIDISRVGNKFKSHLPHEGAVTLEVSAQFFLKTNT